MKGSDRSIRIETVVACIMENWRGITGHTSGDIKFNSNDGPAIRTIRYDATRTENRYGVTGCNIHRGTYTVATIITQRRRRNDMINKSDLFPRNDLRRCEREAGRAGARP